MQFLRESQGSFGAAKSVMVLAQFVLDVHLLSERLGQVAFGLGTRAAVSFVGRRGNVLSQPREIPFKGVGTGRKEGRAGFESGALGEQWNEIEHQTPNRTLVLHASTRWNEHPANEAQAGPVCVPVDHVVSEGLRRSHELCRVHISAKVAAGLFGLLGREPVPHDVPAKTVVRF
jgi:hypothetical protein